MKKIGSIILSVLMLMQIFAFTTFAAEAPGNVHWAKDGDPNKFSDAELVFDLVDGIDVYKITLYKDNQKIYTRISGYGSDTGNFYEDLQDILNDNGPGSYTATVGTLSGTHYDYSEEEDIPTIATSEMSDVLVWTGSVKKEETKVEETPKVEAPTTSTSTQTTTPTTQQNTDLRPFPKVVYITDMYNNELFEIVEESKELKDTRRLFEASSFSDSSDFYAAQYRGGNINVMAGDFILYDRYNPSEREKLKTQYYDGLTVFDIFNIKFPTDGYDKKLYDKWVMIKDNSKNHVEFYGSSRVYEYGYISTNHYTYDPVNNILYVYDFYESNKMSVDFIQNDGELFIFERGESEEGYSWAAKAYKAKIKKPLVVSVCYTVSFGGILDPNEEHDYNGKIAFDQVPVIENGRTLVPLRAIFERIGATVEWDGATQTVKATKGDTTISLTIDNTTAYKNGEAITLDVPAKILNGRTLVPVRFVADCFGVDVEWVQETQTVLLTSK